MVRTRRQIADGAESSESEAEDGPAVPFVRPTQASALLERLPTEVLALVLQDDLAGYSKAKALYERKTKLMLVCQAFADAGRAFGFDEAFITSIRSLDAFYAAVTAVGPDDAKPTSVRMRIRKLSVGITSSSSTYRRHASMIAAVVERCVGLVALKVEHDRQAAAPSTSGRGGRRRRSHGVAAGREQVEVPTKRLMAVLVGHAALETVDAPGEHASPDQVVACVERMPALRSLDTLRIRVSKEVVADGEAAWSVEIAEPRQRWSYWAALNGGLGSSDTITTMYRALGVQLAELHVSSAVSLASFDLRDLASRCPGLRVLDIDISAATYGGTVLTSMVAALAALPLNEIWLAISSQQLVEPALIRQLIATTARIIQIRSGNAFRPSIGYADLAALHLELRGGPQSTGDNRSLILKTVRHGAYGATLYTDAEKSAAVDAALAHGFDLFLD